MALPEPTAESNANVTMKKLNFGFFDDSGQPRESRILMFYSFETEERLSRSGILHYHLAERRFVGPRHDRVLTEALALADEAGVTGKAVTPFLLLKIVELSGGRSLEVNLDLARNNVRVAGETATAWCALNASARPAHRLLR